MPLRNKEGFTLATIDTQDVPVRKLSATGLTAKGMLPLPINPAGYSTNETHVYQALIGLKARKLSLSSIPSKA
jgi:hypothetical protein